jgi:hypothetical protein
MQATKEKYIVHTTMYDVILTVPKSIAIFQVEATVDVMIPNMLKVNMPPFKVTDITLILSNIKKSLLMEFYRKFSHVVLLKYELYS